MRMRKRRTVKTVLEYVLCPITIPTVLLLEAMAPDHDMTEEEKALDRKFTEGMLAGAGAVVAFLTFGLFCVL